MKRSRELTEILFDIRSEIPGFEREELLEYTKWAIPRLYNALKNKQEVEVRCTEELINKLNNKEYQYRINNNIDNISVQYVEIFDNIKRDHEMYIQVYASVYFYDNPKNNMKNRADNDKYYNDIWIVTYRKNTETGKKNSNCVNCGAVMEYNQIKNMFECKYCGNRVHNKSNAKWEIVDIELGN